MIKDDQVIEFDAKAKFENIEKFFISPFIFKKASFIFQNRTDLFQKITV